MKIISKYIAEDTVSGLVKLVKHTITEEYEVDNDSFKNVLVEMVDPMTDSNKNPIDPTPRDMARRRAVFLEEYGIAISDSESIEQMEHYKTAYDVYSKLLKFAEESGVGTSLTVSMNNSHSSVNTITVEL